MDGLPVNAVDLIIAAIVVVSGLLAFARGLVREVLSIIGWVGAAVVTLFGVPHVRPYLAPMVGTDPFLLNVATGVLIFVVTLVALSLASFGIAKQVKNSQLSALDRSLGFIFGLVRGAVLVCLAYMALVWSMPNAADHPRVIQEARSLPLVQMGVATLAGIVPEAWRGSTARRTEEIKRDAEREAQRAAAKALETLVAPQPKAAAQRDTPGYNPKERQDMERLIQGTKGSQP
ncbi:MAG: CvpA family protein [Rhodospirillales bacterium]|nr:CvpA family protein [Rhodospirillales bacterium]